MANRHEDDDAHNLAGVTWEPLGRGFIGIRQLSAAIGWGVVTAAGVVAAIVFDQWWLWAIAAIPALWWAILATQIPRRVRAVGFVCREDDIAIRRGLLLRNLTIIPYGRIQSVDVNSGPLLRRCKLSAVTIATASDATAGVIPAIGTERAAELRDQLTRLGEERMLKL